MKITSELEPAGEESNKQEEERNISTATFFQEDGDTLFFKSKKEISIVQPLVQTGLENTVTGSSILLGEENHLKDTSEIIFKMEHSPY